MRKKEEKTEIKKPQERQRLRFNEAERESESGRIKKRLWG